MVAAKSMEMTGEIQPGWIEAFAADGKYAESSARHAPRALAPLAPLASCHGEGLQAHVPMRAQPSPRDAATFGRYLSRTAFAANDLDEDGVALNVVGALPLVESPLAMRPHYSPAWEEAVLKKNLEAEAEFEAETGINLPDDLVRDSNAGCEVGCALLTLVSQHATDQDRPIFVPIRNGKVIEVAYTIGTSSDAKRVTERFDCID